MAKLTMVDVTSGHTATTTINSNNGLVETAIENTLSRDGTTPNQMAADIDMNGYSVINALATGSTSINFTHTGDWATATAYVVNNIVFVTVATDATNGGASYICTTAHTSGTFSTDLAANWQLFASRGGAGAGTGDLLSTNNLNDVASASTSRTNLGLGTAAVVNTGVTNGDVPAMDATGYPAADGSQITNLSNQLDVTTTGDIQIYGAAAADKLAIGSNGAYLKPNSAVAKGIEWVNVSLRATTGSTVSMTADTWVAVTFNTETEDTSNIHNTTTYTSTIGEDGWYSVHFYGETSSPDANGTSIRFVYNTSVYWNSSAANTTHTTASVVRYLSSSDTISVQVKHGNTTKNLASGAVFQIRKLGG